MIALVAALHAVEPPPDRRATLGAGPAFAIGGPLAVDSADRQARLRGFRLFLEALGDRKALLVVDATVWTGGWIGDRAPEDASGAEVRFEARLPVSPVGTSVAIGWLGGVISAPGITADVPDPFSDSVAHKMKRRTWLGNAMIVGVHQSFGVGSVFVDAALNFLTLISLSDKGLGTWGVPVRAGAEVRPFERTFVRGAGTFSAFGGNGFGWSIDAGVLF